jgi:RNA polymerase sigma-B factor
MLLLPISKTRDTRRRQLEDARLQRRQLSGDPRARAELVERYLPLARRLALRYRNSGEPVDDLVQVASLGLIKALQRWDPDRGTAFSSFAVPTILGELRRYFRDSTWAVKPPRSAQELAFSVSKTRDRMWQDGSGPPTVAQIAGALGRSQEEVLCALEAAAAHRAESLDEPILEAGDETISRRDVIGHAEPGYRRVEDAMVLDELISTLDEHSREVVRLRFREDLLQREIAQLLGCSQMQVSRVLRESLRRLAATPFTASAAARTAETATR